MRINSKIAKVHGHFNNVDHYLHQKFDIKVRSEIVREMVGVPCHADILDCGCGDGTISLQFQSNDNYITLLDVSENMLEKARLNIQPLNSGRVKVVLTEVELFKSVQKYDLVLGIGLLAHVNSISLTIEAISDFLKPGGCCFLQITDKSQIISKLLDAYNCILDNFTGQFGYKRNQMSFEEVVSIAKTHGLVFIESRQYSLLLPGFATLLPGRLMYAYHDFVRRHRHLSSLGSDFIIKFQKR